MDLLQRRALFLALAITALTAGPASAKLTATPLTLLRSTLSAPASGHRVCSSRLLPAGTAGVVQRRLTVPTGGMLEARLLGSPTGAGDWDLAVFDALSGRMLNGSAAFGSNELAEIPVTAGDVVAVQACRVSAKAAPVPLTVTDTVVSGAAPRAFKQQLVSIPFRRPSQLDALAREGVDLNETAKGHSIDAVLHGPGDVAKLRRAGLPFHVRIPDLVAYDRKTLVSPYDPVTDLVPSALPSGRRTYRHLVDYENDMKALVWAHADKVRPVILPQKSVEGRTLEGIEIADDVAATDDGRPTHVEMGLHHVREWPSGEVTMEYAFTLLDGAGKDPRIDRLLAGERTFDFPVINPDGLEATQMAGDSLPVYDDNGVTSLPLAVVGAGPYRRKNCADTTNVGAGLPCAFYDGVDLNRNYGAFWGGPGSGADAGQTDQTFRGTKPVLRARDAGRPPVELPAPGHGPELQPHLRRRHALPAGLQPRGRAGPSRRGRFRPTRPR